MLKPNVKAAVCLALGLMVAVPGSASATEVKTSFVGVGRGVPGVLYEPEAKSEKSGIAVLVMHIAADYLQFSACTELSKRGYTVLCANSSSSKFGPSTDADINQILPEVKWGVDYLKQLKGVRKVVLLGHSGGGDLMAAYQDIAENGLKACQGSEKLLKCPDSVGQLTPADGLMLVDANYGLGTMVLFSLDPAIVDEGTGRVVDPALDLYSPANGFTARGAHYSSAFIAAFQKAVAMRNIRLIAAAEARLAAIQDENGVFSDDEPLNVPGANFGFSNNKLYAQDTSLLSHTKAPHLLLKKDGGTVTEIVHTVRPATSNGSQTGTYMDGALKTTVKTFLGTYAIRVSSDFAYDEDSIRGVDWNSSYTTPISSVKTVSAPLLAMGMTGSWEYLAAEMIYDNAGSKDKSIAFVEGATHLYTTCKECETVPGEYGDTLKTTYDHIDGWLSKPGRF